MVESSDVELKSVVEESCDGEETSDLRESTDVEESSEATAVDSKQRRR